MQKKKVEIRQIKRERAYTFIEQKKKSLRLIKKRHKLVKLWSGMFFSLIVIGVLEEKRPVSGQSGLTDRM